MTYEKEIAGKVIYPQKTEVNNSNLASFSDLFSWAPRKARAWGTNIGLAGCGMKIRKSIKKWRALRRKLRLKLGGRMGRDKRILSQSLDRDWAKIAKGCGIEKACVGPSDTSVTCWYITLSGYCHGSVNAACGLFFRCTEEGCTLWRQYLSWGVLKVDM